MNEEQKAFSVKMSFEGTKMILALGVDTNKDGQPIVVGKLEIDLAECPDEVAAAVFKKKEAKV